MSKHRVLRSFPAKRPLIRGNVYDTTGWRNVAQLVRGRYLEPVADETPETEEISPAEEFAEIVRGAQFFTYEELGMSDPSTSESLSLKQAITGVKPIYGLLDSESAPIPEPQAKASDETTLGPEPAIDETAVAAAVGEREVTDASDDTLDQTKQSKRAAKREAARKP